MDYIKCYIKQEYKKNGILPTLKKIINIQNIIERYLYYKL